MLIDSPQINAFAVPGGIVGINLGLFLHAEDESEYSAVVAHELAHLSQRHYARGIEMGRSMMPWMLAGLLASIAIAASGGGDAGMAAAATTQALIQDKGLRFSRSREQEADRIGLNTLAETGLDPSGRGRACSSACGARSVSTIDRRSSCSPIRSPRRALPTPRTKRNASRNARCRHRTTTSSCAPAPSYATPSRRAPRWPKRRRAKGGGDADRYALAVALAADGARENAVDLMRVLRRDHAESLLMAASFAEVLIDAGHIDEALALLQRELAINPDNGPLTFLYALALNAAQRHTDAAAMLWRHTHVNRDDIDVWELLAETAGLGG